MIAARTATGGRLRRVAYAHAATTIAAAPSETTVRSSGSIVASSEPQRDERVARREEGGADDGQHRPERAVALGLRPLERDRRAGDDDQRGAGDEARVDALAEEHRREHEREQGRDADQDRGARGAGVAHRLDTNTICEMPGHDRADRREHEHVAPVDVVGEGARDERDERDDQQARASR